MLNYQLHLSSLEKVSLGQLVMLPSCAIGNFLFPTYEVLITSLSYSSALISEIIKCSIPLVDSHINSQCAIHAVNSGISNT